MRSSKIVVLVLLVLVIVLEARLLWWTKTMAPAGLLGWEETRDDSPYYGPGAADPPYNLSQEDRDLLVRLVAESGALDGADTDFERICALRNWARSTCLDFGVQSPPTNDPSEILDAFNSGQGGACGAVGTIYCATLMAHGYRARILQLMRDSRDVAYWKQHPPDTHIEVEVFSPDHQKWIVSNPTFNCWFHRPGSDIPLSARELQAISNELEPSLSELAPDARAIDAAIAVEYDGYHTEPTVEDYYIHPVLFFHNVFLIYYDIFRERPTETVDRYTELLDARFSGSEKIVWLLAPDQPHSWIPIINEAANWLPAIGLVLLLCLFIPARRKPVTA